MANEDSTTFWKAFRVMMLHGTHRRAVLQRRPGSCWCTRCNRFFLRACTCRRRWPDGAASLCRPPGYAATHPYKCSIYVQRLYACVRAACDRCGAIDQAASKQGKIALARPHPHAPAPHPPPLAAVCRVLPSPTPTPPTPPAAPASPKGRLHARKAPPPHATSLINRLHLPPPPPVRSPSSIRH